MKSRAWVLVMLALVIAGAGGYIVSFRMLDINGRAERAITGIVSERMGIEFTTSSISILPWSIRLNDVSIQPQTLPLTVSIRHIRIQFNLFALLLHDFQPLYSLEQVFLDDPVLEWRIAAADSVPGAFSFDRPGALAVENLPSTRINIEDGAVVFSRGDSTLVFAEEISGWLDGYRSSDVVLNVEGKVLSDEINTTCQGKLSKVTRGMSLDIVSTGCNLAVDNIEVVSGDIDPASGTLDFTLHAGMADSMFSLDGDYDIAGGSFLLKNLDVGATGIAMSGHLSEREITFDSLTGNVLGMSPELAGRIRLRPEPMLELAVQAAGVPLAGPIAALFPEVTELPSGRLAFSATIAGQLTDLAADADVRIDSLSYRGIDFGDVSANGHIAGDILEVNDLTGQVAGMTVLADARLRDLYHAGERPFGITVRLWEDGVSDPAYTLVTSGTADLDGRNYDARVDFRTDRLPLPVEGRIAYCDDILASTFGDSLVSIEGTVRNPFGDAIVDAVVTLAETPVLTYAGRTGGPVLDGTFMVTGVIDSLSVASGVRIVWNDQFNSRFMADAVVTDVLTGARHLSTTGRLYDLHLRYSPALSWDVSAEAGARGLSATIADPAGATVSLGVDLEDGSLGGSLDLDAFPLEWIIALFVREEFSHRGRITGHADIGGTIAAPWFASPAPLTVTDMTLAGLERLDGDAGVSGSLSSLAFRDVHLRRDGLPILDADGLWEDGHPFVLTAGGSSLELAAIEDVISDSRRTGGTVDYSVSMSFTRDSGTVEGTFSASSGHFCDIPFDHLQGTVSGGSNGFSVDSFTIVRDGVYQGTGTAESGYFWQDLTETPGLRLHLMVDGDIIRVLHRLTGAITDAEGDCTADLIIGGTWQEPIVLDGRLTVQNGVIRPAFLIDRITGIDAELQIEPDTPTETGLLAVRVVSGTGLIGDRRLIARTVHRADDDWEGIVRPGMLAIPNEDVNLDFGVLGGRIEAVRGRDNALKLHIPGFMEDGETGMFALTGRDGDWFYVGASDNGGELTPYLSGRINVLSGDINYPLLDAAGEFDGEANTSFLEDLYWDMEINSGPNVNYTKEYNLEIGRFAGTTLWQNEVRIDENSSFNVTGRLADNSFRVTGQARSSNGFINYYGYRFDIEYAELELDTANEIRPAILTGRARTIVYDDTLGTENEIYLHVDFVDRESGRVTEARGDLTIRNSDYYNQNRPQTRFDAGALGIIEIRFSSTNPSDDTQEKILAKLGVSPDNIGAAATRALTAGIDNYYFNPLLRPFEEKIKQMFRLDMVKISPSIFGTFAQESLRSNSDVYLGTDTFFVDRSRVTLGEYFLKDWFVSYTAQYGVGRDFLFRKEKGFYHDIGIQYSVERNLRFQGRYMYDEIINQDDARLEFRYDFMFD